MCVCLCGVGGGGEVEETGAPGYQWLRRNGLSRETGRLKPVEGNKTLADRFPMA